jgi:hypothetical protein
VRTAKHKRREEKRRLGWGVRDYIRGAGKYFGFECS